MNKNFSFQKILIIQTAFIGDVILATGVVEKLSSFYPNAKIDFLLRKGNEGLLVGNPNINKVIIWDKKKDKISNLFKLISEVREENYDLVVNLQRFLSSGVLTALSKGKITIGFDKNPLSFLFSKKVKHQIGGSNISHEVERNQLLIESFTDSLVSKPRLYPLEKDFGKVASYKKEKYICVAPASVWFTKQFPVEKWIEFINTLPDSLKVYLIGSPQDKDLCSLIIKETASKNVEDLSGKLSFMESAALIQDAIMNYVNDSAPMHIASAMNAPVSAVYCSTIPAFGFGPLSEVSYTVEIKGNLTCRPCGLHGYKKCPEGHFKCGFNISKEQLLQVLNQE